MTPKGEGEMAYLEY